MGKISDILFLTRKDTTPEEEKYNALKTYVAMKFAICDNDYRSYWNNLVKCSTGTFIKLITLMKNKQMTDTVYNMPDDWYDGIRG